MKEKTRKILIMAVMAALIISLMAASLCYAFTYGRYTGGRFDEDSRYDDLIDFVGATAFEVSTPDEFVNAIENGYSYIKIAADAEEPFVVNNDIADVYTNLVLDVNGTTVIRNSRNPVLDVRRSISVVLVYDSSVEGSGGFYNPVGSALQTSGGSLTVGAGSYESGPSDAADATLPTSNTVSLVTRENRTSTEYGTASSSTLPILTKSGGDKTKSGGDKYLPEGWIGTEGAQIKEDTYLLYTEVQNAFVGNNETSGDATFESGQLYVNCKEFTTDGTQTTYSADIFAPDSNVASCDFYYYYPIDESGAYSSTAGTVDSPKTYAVVYGYNDVKGLAEDEDDNNDGIGEATALIDDGLVWPYAAIRSVRDGAVGGVTHARGGAFKTHFGTDNTYGIYSVGGTMTVGTDSASTPPVFTATGEGTCIGMSAQTGDTLTIASGSFSSQVGDTILMRGGEMTVTGGTFTKSGNKARPSGGLEAIEASRTALIHMLGGELTIDGTVTGESDSRTYSVNMTAGSTDAPLTNVFGIYSTETTDETTGKAVEGTVTISGCKITVNGTYSAGVLSSAGTVNLGGTAAGKAETNITVNNSISNNLLTSSAVSSEGGTINLNNTVEIKSDSLGITARGIINVGDETQTAANVTVNTDNATGVYVNNGTLNVKAGATLNVTSTVRSNTQWVQPPEGQTEIPPSIYNGVYVNGGSLNSTGTLNVDFTGVVSDPTTNQYGNNYNLGGTAYRTFKTKSYAVRVEATTTTSSVTIAAGKITNDVGGGVLVNGGTVYLGEEDGTGPVVDTKGTGRYSLIGVTGAAGNWAYTPPSSGGDAVKVDVGTLYVYGGSYTADYGNGILVTNGTANVSGGKFTGTDDRKDGENLYTGAGSNYGLKVLGGSAKITGGEFTAQQYGGGVFIMGTETNNQQTQITAANIHVTGATAVSVWNYADVVFGTENGNNSLLTASAESTGLAVEVTTAEYGIAARQKIVINSGTFTGQTMTGNKHGIWYGNRATMTINGGIFTGGGGSGLFFQVNQWEEINNVEYNRVKVTGGTFIGNGGSIGAVSNGEHNNSDLGYQIRLHDFVDCTTGKSIYYYSYRNATSTNNVVALSAYAWNTGTIGHDAQRIQDNTMDYPKIEIK